MEKCTWRFTPSSVLGSSQPDCPRTAAWRTRKFTHSHAQSVFSADPKRKRTWKCTKSAHRANHRCSFKGSTVGAVRGSSHARCKYAESASARTGKFTSSQPLTFGRFYECGAHSSRTAYVEVHQFRTRRSLVQVVCADPRQEVNSRLKPCIRHSVWNQLTSR